MATYWVDPEGLDSVTSSMSETQPEADAFDANIGTMHLAIGAFSNDDDNAKFVDTLGHIESEHGEIVTMYNNVLDRLVAVSKNYTNSDEAAARQLS